MAERKTVFFETADGTERFGYLTTPKGQAPENLPTIVFPHGNHLLFEGLEFDPLTQFLVNRGYAVFQINQRDNGELSDNSRYEVLRGWGKALQPDIADGTRWLIDQGIADADRLCLLGTSYGGFSALLAAAEHPELFQCVVAYAPVTDMGDMVNTAQNFLGAGQIERMLGDDRSELRKNSPISMADQFQDPVLLIHGDKDVVILPAQSKDMKKALEKAGKAVSYVELKDAEHFLINPTLRETAFVAMASFLNQHLDQSSP